MSLGVPTFTQVVYVEADGSDVAGQGSYESPFLTVGHAMAAITDASTTKRYLIAMGPMVDASNIALKPYVWIQGADLVLSRLTGVLSLDASWGVNVNQQSGFQNIIFAQTPPTFDFASVSSDQGKIYFTTCRFNGTPVFTAFNAINQIVLQDCYMFAGHTQNGINMTTVGTGYVNGGTITLNSATGINALWSALGGGTDGPVTCVYSGGGATIAIQACGFGIAGALTLSGANIQVLSTEAPGSVVLSGGAPSPIIGGGVLAKTTDINAAGPYVVLPTDYMLAVRYTTTGAIAINLPSIAAAGDGRILVSIDSGYNAIVNNITLARDGTDKINNVAGNYTQSINGSCIWLRANGISSNWEIV
jgi:hypothetical protein